ncbi:MAG: alkaline phosphatase family protein [Dysgonamonadaceae bacterium]|jgi:hypothetical protein|nr:alkaline phosphatase family protein [Dysgonamonadaceae bacterium]
MNRIITSLLAILAIAGVRGAEQPGDIPKLVVNITVDKLRGDYLQYFNYSFGERGFKRLMNDGLVYRQMQFEFPNVNRASAIATIFTGTNPDNHSIVAEKKYDFESHREVSILYDKDFLGNYTNENLSPLSLLCATIGDELKMASNGKSDVFAIAPNSVEALLSAGRYANAAFWLEDYRGRFATTTYYKDIPWYVDRYNSNEVIGKNTETYTWNPTRSSYTAFPYNQPLSPFKHYIYKGEKDCYLKIKTSPAINAEVTNLTAKFLEYADFGNRANPSMLSVTYYAGNYIETMSNPYSPEIQDIYIHLDKEIERLLDLVEKYVGIKNTLFVVTSTGYFDSTEVPSESFKTVGEFYPNRCTALLNMYLMTVYGQGNWVNGYYNNQIYLNRKLIEQQKIAYPEILRKCAEFIAQFTGVQNVTTSSELLFEGGEVGNASFRKGMYKGVSGDLFLELQPGRILVDEKDSSKSRYLRNETIIAPLIFFGHRIQPQKVYRIVKATEIAPTVTHVLRIRPPNGCKEMPLQEFYP